MTDLHTTIWGIGEPVVLVHGSFSWGEEAFTEQRELAEHYRLILVDRRGFGRSPPVERCDFEVDARDIVEILGEGGHLVGHSYGGVVSLLAAGLQPERVWSLTVIEPPCFDVARGNPAVEEMIARITQHYEHNQNASSEAFFAGFLTAWGFDEQPELKANEMLVKAIRTSKTERPPWEAKIPLEKLTQASFPKLVISGGWKNTPPSAREIGGKAFKAVCDVLERDLHAQRAVFDEAAHRAQALGKPFNERLDSFLKTAARK